jgi:putative tryptophan/tyrosine transport system substrate-binding protein
MRRREFIGLVGGAAALPSLWVQAAHGQQAAKPLTIGFFHSEGQEASAFRVAAFRKGLSEQGFVEGQNVLVEYRWGEGFRERLPALAADFLARKVAVICAGNVLAARAAKALTGITPIVFLTAGDPIEDQLVASFNNPGGNATGIRIFSAGLIAKRLQLLHELVPAVTTIGFLMNPSNPTSATQMKDVQTAAEAIGLRIDAVPASDVRSLDAAFETLAAQNVKALVVGADPYFTQREQLIALAAHYRFPAIYEWRESAAVGGLMSYGTSLTDAFRNVGIYAGRILKGAAPSELPVMQQTKFELVINLKAAKALGLDVPSTLIARADEVIE